jgi:hypothetical protein
MEQGDPVDILFAVSVALTLQRAQLRQAADVRILHTRPARHLSKR